METIKSDKIEEIEIKIQTMDNVFQITIQSDNTVLQLKEKITNNQRLIFQGKLMKDEEKLVFYKITNQCVVHLVARDLEETQPRIETNTSNSQQRNNESIFEERIPLLFVPVHSNHRRRRRIMMPHYDISECFEALYQNMITIDNLSQCKIPYTQSNNKSETFNLKKSKYEVGQWIDAKDTIDQWLEAQIIQIQNNKAYIHYNGWGTRWDEWIDFESPRMRNFKFYTLQPPSSCFMSPYPGVPCDSNIEPQSRSIDSFFYLEKTKNYLEELLKGMERLCALRKKEKTMFDNGYLNKEDQELLYLATQMIPFMDRVGRMLSDISLQFSHLVVNPNLYPQMLMGYKRNQMFNEEKITKKEDLKATINEKKDNVYSVINSTNNQLMNIPQEQKPNEVNLNTTNEHTITLQENIHEFIPQRQNQSTSTSSLRGNTNSFSSNLHSVHNENLNIIQVQNQSLIQTNLGYNLSSSSNELPFVQRVAFSFTRSDRIVSPSSHIAKLNQNEKAFPKVNLQLPALLSSGEVMTMTGSFPSSEPNFDIYVHTLSSQPSTRNNNTNNSTTSINNNLQNQNNNSITIQTGNTNNISIGTSTEPIGSRTIFQQIPQINQNINNILGINQTESITNNHPIEVKDDEGVSIDSNPLQSIHKFFKDEYTQTTPEDLI